LTKIEIIERQDVMSLLAGLGFSDRFFLTRLRGEQAYERLKSRLQKVAEGNALLLNFPQEQLMDVSFLDETLIRIGEEMTKNQFPPRTLLLQGLTPDTIANLNAAIEFRNLKLAFLAVEPEGQWQCVRKLELSLRETLQLLWNQSSLTAPELSEIKQLAINSASNRLKRLYDLHLIRRDYEVTNKGLQYTYYFWKWTA
jgi:DNA-binding transcriptional ArsR family regulator